MVGQPLEIARGISETNQLETLLQAVFCSSSHIFDGEKYFHIKNSNSWEYFWKHFESNITRLKDLKCLVYVRPQIRRVIINAEKEAVVDFFKSGDGGQFEIEVELSFESGSPHKAYVQCADTPAKFPLATSDPIGTALSGQGIVVCQFRIRNNVLPEFDFGPWSKPVKFFNRQE